MKRKRSDEEEGETPPAKAIKSALTVTDLPEELVKSVLSYMDFFERTKVRHICSRLLRSVDSMPAEPNMSLEIRLFSPASDEESDAETHIRQQVDPSWTITKGNEPSRVRLSLNRYEEDIDRLLSSLPSLKTVRPSRLHVESSMEDGEGVDARLLSHLATEIGSTVTILSVVGLAAPSQAEVDKAFSEFNQRGRVKRLRMECLCPLATAVSAATCLRNLNTLILTIREDMVSDWEDQSDRIGLCLAALASLTHLRRVSLAFKHTQATVLQMIMDGPAVASFLNGISAIPQLMMVHNNLLVAPNAHEETLRSYASMLHGLKDLKLLRLSCFPSPGLWRQIHSIGGHRHLQNHTVCYPRLGREELDALVNACNQDFPALTKLRVQLGNHTMSFDSLESGLSGLKLHPSLTAVKLYIRPKNEALEQSILSQFQEALEPQIKVTLG